MATSGTIRNNFRTGYALQIAWTITGQSIANNTSTVSIRVQLVSTGSSYTIVSSGTKSGTLTVNGSSYNFTFSAALSGGQTKTIFSKSVTIPHDAEGKKTCSFSASAGIEVTLSGQYYDTVTASGQGEFTTIASASTPSIASSIKAGQATIITITAASTAFKHTLMYRIGASSAVIAENVGTSYSWTVPAAIVQNIPNASSGTVTIICQTYNGSDLIGTKSITTTLTVPDNVTFRPSVSSVSITEATPQLALQFGAFVQTKSTLNVSITASAKYSATIQNYTTTIDGATYQGQTFTSDTISSSGTITVKVTVTDSRGLSTTFSQEINVLAYEPPKITKFAAYRINSDGEEDDEGDKVRVELEYSVTDIDGNISACAVFQKSSADESMSNLFGLKATHSFNGVIENSNITFNPDLPYYVELQLTDYFGTSTLTVEIPTGFTLVDYNVSGKGIAFGKVSEKDVMEIALPVEITSQESKIAPTLQNGWVNYTGREPAGYWKDVCGVVHISGFIRNGTVTAGTVLFVLPAGYLPENQETFPAVSNNAFCRIDVSPNGNVYLQYGGNATWLSLSGISFRAKG